MSPRTVQDLLRLRADEEPGKESIIVDGPGPPAPSARRSRAYAPASWLIRRGMCPRAGTALGGAAR
ncbi:hypothetical protein ACIBH1_09205 [Nonomuraea sp. NPDC050663]|uniref:hypothetical protein n=1 Tax=Nonomuraea sp. NPDC050663 TaxID=3364370 RepID=UPI0037A57455